MKKIVLVMAGFLLMLPLIQAQAPAAFSYQAVLRNAAGEVLQNQEVSLRMTILKGSASGEAVYAETHEAVTTEQGLVSLEIGRGNTSQVFSAVKWHEGDYFLQVELDADGGTDYLIMGTTQLLAVPYALYAERTNSIIQADLDAPVDSALFLVKDRDGNIVFAVYEDGVEVIVPDKSKGGRGGFAVGGRSAAKGSISEIMKVTPDSVHIYVNENDSTKGGRGGFVVGGRASTKGALEEFLRVTPDSVRIYIDDETVKGGRGGFAVGGRSAAKSTALNEYLRITPDSSQVLTRDSTGSFIVGNNATGNLENFMNIDQFNYFIGHQSGKNTTTGKYNLALGYQSAFGTNGSDKYPEYGSFNTFIGYQSGYSNGWGSNNVALGYRAGYFNNAGSKNVFIGDYAGYSNQDGTHNLFLGTDAGRNHLNGSANVFIGQSSGKSDSLGQYNIYLGFVSGFQNKTGKKNVIIGYGAGHDNNGDNNIFLGSQAGYYATNVSNKLFVDVTNTPTPLLYGEFDNRKLEINGELTAKQFFNLGHSGTTITLSAGGTITPTTSYVSISSASSITLSASNSVADGSTTGQILVISNFGLYSITIPDNSNVLLSADCTFGRFDTLTLLWTGSYWVELARSNN